MTSQVTQIKWSVADDEAQIAQLIERFLKAVQTRDINAILTGYAREAVIYDVRDTLRYGKEHLRKAWEECFEMSSRFNLEIRDLKIHVSENVAFSYSLNHATGTTRDNEEIDVWMRATGCYGKIYGNWLVVHEHVSVPGDFMKGTLLTDLKP